ncbi:hypothetical protein Q9L58_009033 [Maublancomyces gigas]|uniref:BTB domain-containing protein n=1 Tax=Discina gigas TaxID=1032678 RepID=A0ABR3G8G1_9PEZI
MTRYSVTTAEHGYALYTAFSNRSTVGDLEKAAIRRIVVEYATYIHSITVHYVENTQPAVKRGGQGAHVGDISLESDEWITEIQGTHTPNIISSLKFISNKGKTWGPWGSSYNSFVLNPVSQAPAQIAHRMGLLYFDGHTEGTYICQLKATFAEYPGVVKPPKILKFEAQAAASPSGVIHSTFAKQIMSPIIILRVGPDQTEFRAYEEILCSLPFFRAALQGSFREASEKAITMPEDDPEIIAALIEFLYTGSYTFAFTPPLTGETPAVPSSDVAQGSFHVSVYAVASKYDCDKLVEGAVRNFVYVLKELKGMDVIELWKAAYAKGLGLGQFEGDGEMKGFVGGLAKLVAEAFAEHRGEMEGMVADYPELASDLLRIIAIGHGA